MGQEEKDNLATLVDVVAIRVLKDIEAGDTKALKYLLWFVPIKILAQYAKHEDK